MGAEPAIGSTNLKPFQAAVGSQHVAQAKVGHQVALQNREHVKLACQSAWLIPALILV